MITKTLPNGTELVGWMKTGSCTTLNGIRCAEYHNEHCCCPGADSGHVRGSGIWIEKTRYLELKLVGALP